MDGRPVPRLCSQPVSRGRSSPAQRVCSEHPGGCSRSALSKPREHSGVCHGKTFAPAAYGRAYQIQVSNDNANWTAASSTTASDGGT
jgi:hypothetical protein